MMHHHRWLVSGIVIAAIIVAFVFSVPRTTEIAEEVSTAPVELVPSLSVKDTFRKGVHTLTGTIEAPDACSTISAQASYEGADTEDAYILITVDLAVSEGLCLEIPTAMRFTATVTAPSELPIKATVNGTPATLE